MEVLQKARDNSKLNHEEIAELLYESKERLNTYRSAINKLKNTLASRSILGSLRCPDPR